MGAIAGQEQLTDDLRARANDAAQAWRPGASITAVRALSGGTSSLTYLAQVEGVDPDESPVVLKVAPPGLEPVRNRDVLRQGRLMRALHGRPGVVVPPVRFDDIGDPPETPPFVAMGFVPGECWEPVLADDRYPDRFEEIHARGIDAARVLAAIHSVDPRDAGLGDEPVVTLADEIDRWTRAFETVPDDLQGAEPGAYQRCAGALHASIPPALPPVVNHGDYRIGNTLCAGDSVTSVIDWEIWSLGDPRVDLSWFAYFTDEAGHPAAPTSAPCGMPTAEQLFDAYTKAGGAQLDDLPWFHALTRYKEAAATALLIKRGRKQGDALVPSMQRMLPALAGMLVEAEQMVS